jgi:uncharacterized protein
MTDYSWRTSGLIAVLALAFLILTRLVSEVSFLLAQPIYQSLHFLDPDGSFLYITLHHIWQGSFALLAILILSRVYRIPLHDFGFHLNDWRTAVLLVLTFSLFWFVFQGTIGVLIMVHSDASAAFHFPLTARNFGSYFAFQILLSGTSEEVLFRSLVMTPLLVYGERSGLAGKPHAILTAGIATLIFMLAHINIAFNPLRVTHFNLLQQLTCLVFGCFYAFLFLRTRSILGPILAHNILNAVIVSISLMLFLFFG